MITLDLASVVSVLFTAFIVLLFPLRDRSEIVNRLRCQATPSLTRRPKETAIYRHRTADIGLAERPDWKIKSGKDVIRNINKKGVTISVESVDNPVKFNEIYVRAAKIGSGLKTLDGERSKTVFCGILLENCKESILVSLACTLHGIPQVPLNPNLSCKVLVQIINRTKLATLITSSALFSPQKIQQCIDSCPSLKNVIFIDAVPSSSFESAISLKRLSEVEDAGSKELADENKMNEDCIWMIYYPFETEDIDARGLVLTHRNLLSAIAAFNIMTPTFEKPTKTDKALVSGDLWNPSTLIWVLWFLYNSTSVTCVPAQMKTKQLQVILSTLAPTHLVTTPQVIRNLCEIIYRINSGLGFASKWLVKRKQSTMKKFSCVLNVADDDVFTRYALSPIRRILGGKLKQIYFSHSASDSPTSQQRDGDEDELDEELVNLPLLASLQLTAFYGPPESLHLSTMSTYGDLCIYQPTQFSNPLKHVGTVLPHVEMKCVDSKNHKGGDAMPGGEICVRGNGVAKGWLKGVNENGEIEIKEFEDGWAKTNVLGRWLPNGALSLTSWHQRHRL
ncbi:hypothetical protein BKA69DRAFT_1043449 [Paraphysoderma sedebokerense]|nr:hypothetical protein BKA69DRAFT_1043449 [Paraphysoderma sedebokerense]